MKNLFASFFCLTLFVSIAQARIELPGIFTNNMVLQQKTDAPLWGKTTPGKAVKIVTSWNNREYKVLANADGSWLIKVKTPQAGGPYSISIADEKKIILENILIGEVWICSGQSNMEMPLAGWGKINCYEIEMPEADYPQIRLLHIEKTTSVQPLSDVKTKNEGWQICSPSTVAEFSAVAYFFGRNLHQHLHVPIGLINSSWGGTIAEAWTSKESLENMPYFKESLLEIQKEPESTKPNRPSVLFNAMIKPLIPYAMQGVIWYQGESNAARPAQYRELFPLLIRDWRKQWNRTFPFYFVQIANFKNPTVNWPELREAQLMTLNVENTGMAVTIDIGDPVDIHPKNKKDVGIRLALAARSNTYGEKINYSGPIYESYLLEQNQIRIVFKHNKGLKAKGDSMLEGFEIAGSDHQFYPAKTVIEANSVIVSCPQVEFPVAVRYAWANNPVCNLYNEADLPASPFRTDDWKE